MKQYKVGLIFSQIQRIALTLEGVAERGKKITLRCYEGCQQFSFSLGYPVTLNYIFLPNSTL